MGRVAKTETDSDTPIIPTRIIAHFETMTGTPTGTGLAVKNIIVGDESKCRGKNRLPITVTSLPTGCRAVVIGGGFFDSNVS